MTLHDAKTGARWPCDSHAHGKARAVDLGLKEYEITEDGMDPADNPRDCGGYEREGDEMTDRMDTEALRALDDPAEMKRIAAEVMDLPPLIGDDFPDC